MSDFELLCTELISNAGMSKSSYVEAISSAKEGDYDKAKELLAEGDEYFLKGHEQHFKMLQSNYNIQSLMEHLLVIHAEDQMANAEVFQSVAKDIIDLYEKVNKHEI